ncbi:MAG: hypothetical protein ITG02_14760 [Patulibacter sp.]|nr:hypothetical protein [Patulibacter sp.]
MNASAPDSPSADAGFAAATLIAHPAQWIHRRVETIELLTHEETRRRVSIDFSIPPDRQAALTTPDGVVVPIATLTKEARRNFDLRDESGRAIPALSKRQNGELVLASVAELAARVLDEAKINLDDYELDLLLSDLRDVITGSPVEALAAAADFAFDAAEMNPVRQVCGAIRAFATSCPRSPSTTSSSRSWRRADPPDAS